MESREGVSVDIKSSNDDSRRLVIKLVLMPFVNGKLSLNLSLTSLPWDPRASYAVRVDGNDSFPSYAYLQQKAAKLNSTMSTNVSTGLADRSGFANTLPPMITANIDAAQINTAILVRLIDLNKSPISSEPSLDVARGFLDVSTMFLDALKNCFDASRSSDGHSRLQSRLTFVSNKDESLTMEVSVEASFTVDGISNVASAALSRAIEESSTSLDSRNRIELGLKQAFVMADTDNSGFVTFEEANSPPYF